MNVALLTSNLMSINEHTIKGTEIFVNTFTKKIAKESIKNHISITAFASGDSKLPVKIESTGYFSSLLDKDIGMENHYIFELALISKAFSMQDQFDFYHVNLGNGELILPFACFVKKPILITLHWTLEKNYTKKFFDLFKDLKHIYFISISDSLRRQIPDLNYLATIYHGIDVQDMFRFDQKGGDAIMWTGRGIPDKGPDVVLEVLKRVKRNGKIIPIVKKEYADWLEKEVIKKSVSIAPQLKIEIHFNLIREKLASHYRSSKLFLFPIQWEEPFGLVMIEALASGTPVIAFARGSVPEIIKDGETGFIVNSSKDDIRGNWITKKTGIEGMCEAVEKIYNLPKKEYYKMRSACRNHAIKNFGIDQMVDKYINTYESIYKISKSMNKE